MAPVQGRKQDLSFSEVWKEFSPQDLFFRLKLILYCISIQLNFKMLFGAHQKQQMTPAIITVAAVG